jgi:hypothetical protein
MLSLNSLIKQKPKYENMSCIIHTKPTGPRTTNLWIAHVCWSPAEGEWGGDKITDFATEWPGEWQASGGKAWRDVMRAFRVRDKDLPSRGALLLYGHTRHIYAYIQSCELGYMPIWLRDIAKPGVLVFVLACGYIPSALRCAYTGVVPEFYWKLHILFVFCLLNFVMKKN